MNKTLYDFYHDYKEKLKAYQLAASTMYFDLATIAPKKGKSYRNNMLAILQGEAFTYEVHPDHLYKLETLHKLCEQPELKKELGLYLQNLDQKRFLPKDFYVSFKNITADSEDAWLQAKEADDYAIFKPYLLKMIEMQKEALSYIPKDVSDYDYMLDRYQKGTNTAFYDQFFDKVKTSLLPLIKQIQDNGKQIDDQVLKQSYDISKQHAFQSVLCDYMQVDQEKCYLTTSEHPFTSFFGPHETRLTTHYYEHDVMSVITSLIHEYGHALYSLQIDPAYHGTSFKDCIGFAMHESQSRFMENHIGRHPSFWKANYPKLKALFPDQLNDVSLDEFMKKMNVSRPSFIRIEADELTYPIHILIRYEIEKELFNGSVDVEQLESLWNDKYEEYLGIRPNCARDGILQDMHWGAGDFGYFPTYALGSAFAAQFYHAISSELNIDQLLEDGHFEEIAKWLKTHIHQFGASKTADEIIVEATGEAFNANYYIQYLIDKFSTLYEI